MEVWRLSAKWPELGDSSSNNESGEEEQWRSDLETQIGFDPDQPN